MPRTPTQYLSGFLLLAAALAVGGCGNQGRPKLGQVHGRITLDGKPLAKVIVIFHPEIGVRESRGVTNENGEYALTYIREEMGAAVGNCTVKITKQLSNDPQSEIVPEKFNKKTTLQREVKPGENEINFELTSK